MDLPISLHLCLATMTCVHSLSYETHDRSGAPNGRGPRFLEPAEPAIATPLEERDLGVIMHRSAKPSRQCAEASKKANSTVGMIRRTIVTRDKDTILRLYKSLVRPQLEYCIQVWSPYLKQDMEKLE